MRERGNRKGGKDTQIMYFTSPSISLISSSNYFSTKKIISKGQSNVLKRLKLNVLSFCAAKPDSN